MNRLFLAALLLAPLLAPPLARAAPLLDRFGQPVGAAYPGKVSDEAQLRADERLKARAKPAPAFKANRFGGLSGSGKALRLRATGFFHVERHGGRWLLVDPMGDAFFHLGVCVLAPGDEYTLVAGRESAYEWLPPRAGAYASAYRADDPRAFSFHLANLIRKTGRPYDLESYTARMIGRLKGWGFNSAGAFSPPTQSEHAANFPFVGHLPVNLPILPGVNGVFDPFEPSNAPTLAAAFAKYVAPAQDDPLLIGYYLSNEPLLEDVPRVVPTLDRSHACKRELVVTLHAKYQTIAAFNAAWGVNYASFEALDDAPLPVRTPRAAADMGDYTALFLNSYFRLLADTFHRYDRHHLLLGNRLQAGTINNETLCRLMGRYCDVVSFNYYTDALDSDLLKRIYRWSGERPLMLSEFYWSAPAQSGLGGVQAVNTQRERGLAYRNYVEGAASLGFVVGTEWFTLVDQSATGRWFEGLHGEGNNTGLLSVADRPWSDALSEMTRTNSDIYRVSLGERAPFVWNNPRFQLGSDAAKTLVCPHAIGPVAFDGTGAGFGGLPAQTISPARMVQGTGGENLGAAFKTCWDDDNFYLLAIVKDPTPMNNAQEGANLWNGDGLELFIGSEGLDGGGPLLFSDRQVLLGAGHSGQAFIAHALAPTQCKTVVVPGVDGKGYTLEAAIPWAALGVAPAPRAGRELRFDLAVDDGAANRRERQLMWNGSDKNSTDRTHWGRMKLAP